MNAVTLPEDGVQLRRANNSERFVAFAFAAADLVTEIEPCGRITYAAGAFQTRFGRPSDSFVGRRVRDIVDPADHATLDAALLLLAENGRLLPMVVRVADRKRTRLVLAGLLLAPPGCPIRLCLTLSMPPVPLAATHRVTPHALARTATARLRDGTLGAIGLLQVTPRGGMPGDAVGAALRSVAPDAVASEVAPGRFGLLDAGGGSIGLADIAVSLEAALLAQGVTVAIASHHLPLVADGLTAPQAARALRQALQVFARTGTAGLAEAGLADGLSGYLSQAGAHSAALRHAIAERQFELLFQPIVALADRKLHHYEALLRPKPVPGFAFGSPQEFVMMVETLGLNDELDLAVADVASLAAVRLEAPVAFNVSGQSMQSSAFRDRILAVLLNNPACRAGRLMVEMTETAEVEDLAEAARTAVALRAIGVPFCLDDFGAGAADVRLLRSLPADLVKLDGSYVAGVVGGGRERAFVAALTDVARAVEAEIVAERVETEAEAAALQALGITYGQGWLFGRPAKLSFLTDPNPAASQDAAPQRAVPKKVAPPAPVQQNAAWRRGTAKEGWA